MAEPVLGVVETSLAQLAEQEVSRVAAGLGHKPAFTTRYAKVRLVPVLFAVAEHYSATALRSGDQRRTMVVVPLRPTGEVDPDLHDLFGLCSEVTESAVFGVALCDRCGESFHADDLTPDPDIPGELACAGCLAAAP